MHELKKGNCLDLIPMLKDDSIDLVLMDPPYSSGGLHAGARKASTRAKYTSLGFNGASRFPSFSGDQMDQRAFTGFMREVFTLLAEKIRPNGVIACFTDWRQLPSMTDVLQISGFVWRGIVVWDKKSSRNIPGRYRNDCEYIVWGTKGDRPVDWNGASGSLPGCYRVSSVPSAKKNHQTEKPVELLEGLLGICPDGGTVLDCFMGSGSTGVACVNKGLDFIGIEMSDYYFAIAENRIKEAELNRIDSIQ